MHHLTSDHWTVEKLVRSFEDGEIAIPEIQREYVWDDDQVKNLLDSIDNDYPCGSVILWEPGKKDAKLVRDLIKPERRKRYEDSKRNPKYFLLDGQQRMTSLYHATLRGKVVETVTPKKKRGKLGPGLESQLNSMSDAPLQAAGCRHSGRFLRY